MVVKPSHRNVFISKNKFKKKITKIYQYGFDDEKWHNFYGIYDELKKNTEEYKATPHMEIIQEKVCLERGGKT